jgi:hypothetical protein
MIFNLTQKKLMTKKSHKPFLSITYFYQLGLYLIPCQFQCNLLKKDVSILHPPNSG